MAMRAGQLDVPLLRLFTVGDRATTCESTRGFFVIGATGCGKTGSPIGHLPDKPLAFEHIRPLNHYRDLER